MKIEDLFTEKQIKDIIQVRKNIDKFINENIISSKESIDINRIMIKIKDKYYSLGEIDYILEHKQTFTPIKIKLITDYWR